MRKEPIRASPEEGLLILIYYRGNSVWASRNFTVIASFCLVMCGKMYTVMELNRNIL